MGLEIRPYSDGHITTYNLQVNNRK